MLLRSLLLFTVLFSLPCFAKFEGDWAARDLYSFIGVKNGASIAEIIIAFTEGADELGAANRAGLNGQSRMRAITNVRNILIEEHSRSVYNAYMEACRNDGVDPGTADQQQQMMAEYLKRHKNVGIDSHRELFPKFHAKNPARRYPATDFALHPLAMSQAAEVATPLVEPQPIKWDDADCGMKLSNFRRLVLILAVGGVIGVTSHVNELNPRSDYGRAPQQAGSMQQEAAPQVDPPPVTAQIAEVPKVPKEVAPAIKGPTPTPPVSPPTPVLTPQPAAEPPRAITPEKGAADRGQSFRKKIAGGGN